MEPCWSPVLATSGNRSQTAEAQMPLRQAKTVAVGCLRLRARRHGKEGVSGSSPEEGSKLPANAGFLLPRLVQRSTSFNGRGSVCSMTPKSPRRALGKALPNTSLAGSRQSPFLGTGSGTAFGCRRPFQVRGRSPSRVLRCGGARRPSSARRSDRGPGRAR